MNRTLRSIREPAGLPMLRITILVLFMATAAGAADRVNTYLKKPEAWFAGNEAKTIADHILSYQSEHGGWPKNIDTTAAPHASTPDALKPTFDNSATTDELRFLARMYNATREDRYRRAFERGYDYILKAQYPKIMYHPPEGGSFDEDENEFIEIQNVGASSVQLEGLTLSLE